MGGDKRQAKKRSDPSDRRRRCHRSAPPPQAKDYFQKKRDSRPPAVRRVASPPARRNKSPPRPTAVRHIEPPTQRQLPARRAASPPRPSPRAADSPQTVADEWLADAIDKGVDGIRRDFSRLRSYIDVEATTFDCAANADRNRFGDVQCGDATRVRLLDGDGGDYIHASHVKGEDGRHYLCAQAPLPTTAADFWRMCWQEQCVAIVMLCQTVERGVDKSHQYWPARPDDSVKVGSFTVTSLCRRKIKDGLYESDLRVERRGQERPIQHLQYTDWPDKGAPTSPDVLLEVRQRLRRFDRDATLVVHCAAGIGRTGTFVAMDVALCRLAANRQPVDLAAVVRDMRNQRMHSVQTAVQYVFIHQALVTQLLNTGHPISRATSKFLKDCTAGAY